LLFSKEVGRLASGHVETFLLAIHQNKSDGMNNENSLHILQNLINRVLFASETEFLWV